MEKAEKKDMTLILTFSSFGSFLIAMAEPTVGKELAETFSSEVLALKNLILYISIVICYTLGKSKKFREILNKIFLRLASIGCSFTIIASIIMQFYYTPIAYLIIYITYVALIDVYVGRTIVGFRAQRFNGADRETFDNDKKLWSAASYIAGSSIAAIHSPSLSFAIILYGIGSLGILGWVIVYLKRGMKKRA